MPIGTLTLEKVQDLCAARDKLNLNNEVDDLMKATTRSLWVKDLDAVEKELDVQDKNGAKVEEARMRIQRKAMNGSGRKTSRDAPKNSHQNQVKKVNNVETNSKPATESVTHSGSVPEALKRKGRAKTQNRYSKKPPLADTGKDVGVLELKEQLAAHNFPPVQPAAKEANATQDMPAQTK